MFQYKSPTGVNLGVKSEKRCSDPSFESHPSNEYSLLRLTHVMNSIFLDPSDEFLTQVVNSGIPKQILGFCQCSDQLPRHGRGWQGLAGGLKIGQGVN